MCESRLRIGVRERPFRRVGYPYQQELDTEERSFGACQEVLFLGESQARGPRSTPPGEGMCGPS